MESSSVVSLNLCMPLATVHISFGSASADSSGCFPNQSNAAGEEDIFLSALKSVCLCFHVCIFVCVGMCACLPNERKKQN